VSTTAGPVRVADGSGLIKANGKPTTARCLAWELVHGTLPPGARVAGCPADPACVRVEHLSVQGRRVARQAAARPEAGAAGVGHEARGRALPQLDGNWFSPEIGRRRLRDIDEQTIDRIVGQMRRAGLSAYVASSHTDTDHMLWAADLARGIVNTVVNDLTRRTKAAHAG
jgi:hypothetical protein